MSTNPYFTQLHTQRFSFVGSPQQRDGTNYTKDQRFLNVYPELIRSPISDGKKYYLKSRPGLDFSISLNPATSSGVGRGLYYWAQNNTFYFVIGNTVYASGTSVKVLTTSTGNVGFTEYLDNSGNKLLIIADGTVAYSITTTNVFTTLTGAPSPHIPMPIYMDGYIFLAAANSNVVWNCALNTPTSWPSDQFIDIEMYPGTIQALVKNMNYLCVVGNHSIEFLYDNANSTGSPLQRNAPAVSQFGTPAPGSVNQTEKQIILVGQTGNGGRTVWLIEGFQPTEIANAPVREALDQEGTTINTAMAFTVQSSGHKWYVLNLYGTRRTFVYDFEEQMWHEWSFGATQTAFYCDYATDTPNGYPLMQNATTGALYNFSELDYTDNGTPIQCSITTVKLDFDTEKRKRLFRLSLVGDSPQGDTNTPISVYFSDDDYVTWNGPRTLNMNGTYSTITNMGLFRRRAFQFVYNQPFPLRLEAFELDITQEVRR